MSKSMERRAWGWPVGIVVGLGVVVVANAIMISIAISHPSAPAAKDHWAESLAWDHELELRERSAALGWSIASLGWADAAREQIELTLVDSEGRALTGLRGSVAVERADTVSGDVRVELRELGEGRYVSDGAIARAGLVRLTVAVQTKTGEQFVTRQRLDLASLSVQKRAPR